MKHVKKFLCLAAALTLVVALSGCILSFSIDMWLDPSYEFNQVKVVLYIGWGDGTITEATHRESGPTGTFTYNMLTDPAHYTWVTKTVPFVTIDEIVCYWAAHHPGPGWTHTVTLTIRDTQGQTATATITKSI